MRKTGMLKVILYGLCGLGLAALLLWGIQSTPQASAGDLTSLPTNQPFIPDRQDSLPVDQIYTVQVGDVTLQASHIQVAPEMVSFQLCFQVPFQSDWAVDRLALVAKEQEFTDFASLQLDEPELLSGQPAQCTLNRIDLPVDLSSMPFVLKIDRISNSIPEQPDCDAAQKKLNETGSGIKFVCQQKEYMFGFDILEKPAGMTDLGARQVVDDMFHEVIKGPWIFEIKP